MKYGVTDFLGNVQPHIDIEKDIQEKKDGLFTFNLIINQGNIKDYAQYRTVTYTEYRVLVKEPPLPSNPRVRSTENAIRPGVR
jgi:hypothetical protein